MAHDSAVVKQPGTTLRGRWPQSWCVCVCVSGDYPLHNPWKQTDSICRGLCLNEVITHGADLQPSHTSTNTHIHTYTHRGVSTQTAANSHEFPWQLQTNRPCMWWHHPSRKKGRNRGSKNRLKVRSKARAEMKATVRDKGGFCSCICFSLCKLHVLFITGTLKKIPFAYMSPLPLVAYCPARSCWPFGFNLKLKFGNKLKGTICKKSTANSRNILLICHRDSGIMLI